MKKFFYVAAIPVGQYGVHKNAKRASEAYTTAAGAMKAMGKMPNAGDYLLNLGWQYDTKNGWNEFNRMSAI